MRSFIFLVLPFTSEAWTGRHFGVRRQATTLAAEPETAAPAAGLKVTVLGGSGFVGSRVCKKLVEAGAEVVSVSKSGSRPSAEAWASAVDWRTQDLTRGARDNLEAAVGAPDVLVSCVGSVGFDMQGLILGNGIANVAGVKAAAKAGCSRYVYVSVSAEVAACEDGWLPGYFSGYFKGKRMTEAAMAEAGSVCLVKPTFIYGGESFGLFPPRVTDGYGSGIEELLSNGAIKALADFMPGLIKVALRPPVSVDAVAGAVANGALGSGGVAPSAVLDGTADINQAAGAPEATGLTDFIAGVQAKVGEMTGGDK